MSRASIAPERHGTPATLQRQLATGLLVLLLLLESVLFYIHVVTGVAPFYPPAHDQVGYLTTAYWFADIVREHGLAAALSEAARYPLFKALFPWQGAALTVLSGLPRVGALTVNLVYFLLLQLTVFWFVLWKRGSISEAWIAIALVLLMRGAFAGAGGIFDFRIDFMAMCLFGVWTCVVLRSGLFRRLGWSIVAALIAAWLAANRYISLAYLGPIMTVALAENLIRSARSASRIRRALAWRRVRNIVASGLVIALCVAPLLWLNLDVLRVYYYESMFVDDEAAIRAREYVGSRRLWDHLLFYPGSIALHHLGILWLVVCATVLLGLLVSALIRARQPAKQVWRSLGRVRSEIAFLLLVIVLPLVVLNLSIHKSPVVGGILSIPILLLIAHLAWALRDAAADASDRGVPSAPAKAQAFGRAAAVVLVAFSGLVFAYRMAAPKSFLDRAELSRINEFMDKIIAYVLSNNLANPWISVDRVAEFLGSHQLTVASYERHGKLVQFCGHFGHNIFGETREQALRALAESDIVVMTTPSRRAHIYPLDDRIQEYWPEMMAWARENLHLIATMELRGVPHSVYVRPLAKLEGVTTDGWIVSSGATLTVQAAMLARWPFIVLTGEAPYKALGGAPAVKAVVVDGPSSAKELPTMLSPAGRHYRMVIDGRSAAPAAGGRVRIALTFDRHVVPRKLGINEDTRELVIMAPSRSELQATLQERSAPQSPTRVPAGGPRSIFLPLTGECHQVKRG